MHRKQKGKPFVVKTKAFYTQIYKYIKAADNTSKSITLNWSDHFFTNTLTEVLCLEVKLSNIRISR